MNYLISILLVGLSFITADPAFAQTSAASVRATQSKQFTYPESNQAYTIMKSCLDEKGWIEVLGECASRARALLDPIDTQTAGCIYQCLQSTDYYGRSSCKTCVQYYSDPAKGYTMKTYSACDGVCYPKDPTCPRGCNETGQKKKDEIKEAAELAATEWEAAHEKSGSQAPASGPAGDSSTSQPSANTPPAANQKSATPSKIEPTKAEPKKPKEKLALVSFDKLGKKVVKLSKPKVLDQNGKPLPAAALKSGLKLTDKLPAVRLQYPLKKIKAGQTVSVEPPKGLPVQKLLLTAAKPIQDATLTVTVVDGAKPKLLGEGALGSPDYPVPADDEAFEEKYEVKNYFMVGVTGKKEQAHPWKAAAMKYLTPLPMEQYAAAAHWSGDDRKWNDLPADLIECGKSCLWVTQASTSEFFAIGARKK